jgi:outer membrane protein assembly factor BamB
MRTFLVLALCGLAAALSPLFGADWPGWRGPDRTGVSTEKGLLKTWPSEGPKLVWESDKAGLGYAGLAIAGGTVYTMGARGDDEYILALDDKGQQKWATKVGPIHDWKENSWSRGPNCTPTVDGDLVFGLSSKGELICVNKADGKPVWRLDLLDKLAGLVDPEGGDTESKLGWGYSWSPLVDGNHLIIAPGGPKGLLAALNKKDGSVVWRSKAVTDKCTYSSPLLATLGGVKQVLYLTQTGLVSVRASDGELLWQHRREKFADVVCPTPIVRGDMVYVSVGYGGSSGGSEGLKVTAEGSKFTVKVVYTKTGAQAIGNRQGGVVLVGDHVYGYNEDRSWACQEFTKGTLVWPKKTTRQRIKAGGVLAADGRLYVLDEQGIAAMLDASPKGYKVLGQFKLPKASKQRKSRGGIWTHPSLSDGKLYLRDQELVFCYQVK